MMLTRSQVTRPSTDMPKAKANTMRRPHSAKLKLAAGFFIWGYQADESLEDEAVCRHCLQILTAEMIKIGKFLHNFPLIPPVGFMRFRFRFISIVARRLKITENEQQAIKQSIVKRDKQTVGVGVSDIAGECGRLSQPSWFLANYDVVIPKYPLTYRLLWV